MSRSPKGIAAIRPTVAGERLTRRHRDAILEIAKSSSGAISEGRLRRAIGSYATNVIKSLERRDLIAYQLPLELSEGIEGSWILTEHGRQLLQDLANNRLAAT